MRCWISTINPLHEYQSRIPCLPCTFNNLTKDNFRSESSYNLSRPWIDEIVLLVSFQCLHECVSHSNRNIKVVQFPLISFDLNKFEYIRMVYPKNPHVCPSSRTTLFYNVSSHIINPHKRNRSTGNSTS